MKIAPINNRINSLFETKSGQILSVYFTAGYPEPDDTVGIITLLEKSGADLVEIGIPFSDPTADGPIIQQSSERALKNGMTMKKLFQQLKDIRSKVKIPLILMGYFNPVLQFGVEQFCRQCQETGIDGVILPDLPPEEYFQNYQAIFESSGLHNILLITPQTTDDRIREIDQLSSGFIYMVSSSSTTGAGKKVEDFRTDYFERVAALNLKNPRLIGFGISDKATFNNACKYASGAIIGSAFVKALGQMDPPEKVVPEFIRSLKD